MDDSRVKFIYLRVGFVFNYIYFVMDYWFRIEIVGFGTISNKNRLSYAYN